LLSIIQSLSIEQVVGVYIWNYYRIGDTPHSINEQTVRYISERKVVATEYFAERPMSMAFLWPHYLSSARLEIDDAISGLRSRNT
jgi:hypothetical protein